MVRIRSLDLVDAEVDHLLRRRRELEERRRRLVDAGVGRLRREHHGDQQRERVDVLELALGLGHRLLETREDLVDLGFGQPPRLRRLRGRRGPARGCLRHRQSPRASGGATNNLAPAGRTIARILRNRPIPLYTQPP